MKNIQWKKKAIVAMTVLSMGAVLLAGCQSGTKTEAQQPAVNHDQMNMAASTEKKALTDADLTPITYTKLPDGQYEMPYKLVDGVKEFEITAKVSTWKTEDGQIKEVWSYNGTVPGPQIRVTEGDKVRIKFKNELPESTVLHMHGLHLPNNMDGVVGVTQDEIKPGGTFTYEFTADPVGTHMYHSHFNTLHQVDMGLSGNIIVEPKQKTAAYAQDLTYMLYDGGLGYLINGKSFPSTEPIVVKAGEKIRMRFSNIGNAVHPMHLHGMDFKIIAKDGHDLPESQQMIADTLSVNPGERYDIEVIPTQGTWLFHCHVLPHVHGADGKDTGMILVIQAK